MYSHAVIQSVKKENEITNYPQKQHFIGSFNYVINGTRPSYTYCSATKNHFAKDFAILQIIANLQTFFIWILQEMKLIAIHIPVFLKNFLFEIIG